MMKLWTSIQAESVFLKIKELDKMVIHLVDF